MMESKAMFFQYRWAPPIRANATYNPNEPKSSRVYRGLRFQIICQAEDAESLNRSERHHCKLTLEDEIVARQTPVGDETREDAEQSHAYERQRSDHSNIGEQAKDGAVIAIV